MQLILNDATDVKSMKGFITPQFIQGFLELFDSEENYERDYLKNILHKLYAKVGTFLRCFRHMQKITKIIVGAKEKDDPKSDKRLLLSADTRKSQI